MLVSNNSNNLNNNNSNGILKGGSGSGTQNNNNKKKKDFLFSKCIRNNGSRFHVERANLSTDDCRKIAKFLVQHHASTLTEISVNRCNISRDSWDVFTGKVLSELKGLKHLRLENVQVVVCNNDGGEEGGKFGGSNNNMNKNKSGSGDSIAKFEALSNALVHLKNLEVLNLERNSIGNDEIKLIADGIRDNRCLKNLFLGRNEIDDGGCVAIAKIVKNSNALQSLDLSNNKIGDRGCHALAWSGLNYNKSLTKLNIWDNPQISENGLNEFADVLIENNSTLQSISGISFPNPKLSMQLTLNYIGKQNYLLSGGGNNKNDISSYYSHTTSVLRSAGALRDHNKSISCQFALLRSNPHVWCNSL